MKHFSTLVFFLFFRLVSGCAQGLPGYVLTLVGDTVKGMVVERANERILLYTNSHEQRQIFRPAQVQGYGLRGRQVVRSRVVHLASGADSVHFALPMQLGRASLYSYTDERGLLLLPAATDTLYELTAYNWHLLFARYLSGCPSLDQTSANLMDLSFTEPHVQLIIAQYNECLDPNRRTTSGGPKQSVWLKGIGLHAMPFYAYDQSLGDFSTTGNGGQLGLEWTWLRASGLQVILSGSYVYVAQHTQPYQDFFSPQLDEQLVYRGRLISTAAYLYQRLGQPGHINFFAGLGVGSIHNISTESETKQRAAGSSAKLETVATVHQSGGTTAHGDITAGLVVPLGNHQEMRLAAVYQHYSQYTAQGLNTIGMQVTYCWFRK